MPRYWKNPWMKMRNLCKGSVREVKPIMSRKLYKIVNIFRYTWDSRIPETKIRTMPGMGSLRKPDSFELKRGVTSHKRYNVLNARLYNVSKLGYITLRSYL